MTSPTLVQIDEIRGRGFRPGVVGCFVNDSKVLLLFKAKYKLWLFPQGGIENGEAAEDALRREMREELGDSFVDTWELEPLFFYEDEIQFSKSKQGDRELKTDSGEEVQMLGKHYYYFVVAAGSQKVDIDYTGFDQYEWLDYKKASFLAERIYQKNKAKALAEVLTSLQGKGFIS